MPWIVSQDISLGLMLLKWGLGRPDSILAHVVVQTASKAEISADSLSSASEL